MISLLGSSVSLVLAQVADGGMDTGGAATHVASAWDWLLSPASVGMLLSVVAAILAAMKWLDASRKRTIAEATFHAFNIVEDLDAALTKSPAATAVLDKVAQGLKSADEWMVANGWRTLSDEEKTLVKLGFQSIHGAQKSEAASMAAASP